MSAPINTYSSRGDPEKLPMGLPRPDGAGPQPEGTHSSLTKSVANAGMAEAEGAQWDDDEDSTGAVAGFYAKLDGKSDDPNMSGPRPTEQAYDWKAGGLSAWDENDDYREFTFNTNNVAESRLLSGFAVRTGYTLNDNDYDDNGGNDTPVQGADQRMAGASGAWGADNSQPQASWEGGQSSQGGIAIEAIIRR